MVVEKITKKIFLNERKTKWCKCIVFKEREDMRKFYKEICVGGNYDIEGASVNYVKLREGKRTSEVSTVILYFKGCGAGVVSHELLHATIWASKHPSLKNQYPIVIKSMKEEERLLHNHTFAVVQFYNWFWSKVQPKFK